jgi:uncharacterized tellurite resistance protein B-like protein
MNTNEAWTATHDLALIYIALAYGTDHDLSDGELQSIKDALADWSLDTAIASELSIEEVVIEATAAFIESDPDEEIRRAIQRLHDDLSPIQRRRALEDMVRIAEADGVMLEREQGLIGTLAEAWSLKQLSEDLLDASGAIRQDADEDWSVIHELAFVYLLTAHSPTNEINDDEIDIILQRLQEWQPSMDKEAARSILRSTMRLYNAGPVDELVQTSIQTLRESLPDVQRLAVLDDINCIARVDGDLTDAERDIIQLFARAWDLNVRLNGHC